MKMYQRLAVAAASASVLCTGLVVAPASATHDCVSDYEWSLVKRGWTKTRVHNLFDVVGVRESYYNYNGYIDETRAYRACKEPGDTRMYLGFNNYSSSHDGMRVSSKSFSRSR